MAAVTGTVLAIAAGVGALVTVANTVQQRQAMKKEEARYKKDAKAAEEKMKAQQKEESMAEFKADKVARQRQIKRKQQTQNRSGTLLTNPLNTDSSATQAKTLLGS